MSQSNGEKGEEKIVVLYRRSLKQFLQGRKGQYVYLVRISLPLDICLQNSRISEGPGCQQL